MNRISWGNLKKSSIEALADYLPLLVTFEGQDAFVLGSKDEVIILSDLHPRVRNMLLAQERKARVGMPANEDIEPVFLNNKGD